MVLLFIALALTLAQSSSQPADQTPAPPSGPVLQPTDGARVVCDPSSPGFRYLEVRGSGFDAFATQRLVGSVSDTGGAPRIRWSSIWVTPQGQLTLEVNLCADGYQNHGALPPGDYTVSVGQNGGPLIAATVISLMPPPQPEQTGSE
jgi:hypothetical protein